MKRLMLFVVALSMLFALSGCKTKAEKELERAQEAAAAAEEAYWRAKKDYDDLVRDLERYNQLVDQLEKAG